MSSAGVGSSDRRGGGEPVDPARVPHDGADRRLDAGVILDVEVDELHRWRVGGRTVQSVNEGAALCEPAASRAPDSAHRAGHDHHGIVDSGCS